MIYETYSPQETEKLGYEMGKNAKAGDVYCLSGDLGVGKTVFTRGFAKGLEVEDEYITSPTFTIINEHNLSDDLKLFHFDVYRFDYEDYYLIRGIIKGDYKGYSIAFNPDFCVILLFKFVISILKKYLNRRKIYEVNQK